MKYLSGQFALNIPCQLDTYGDWHILALDWSNPDFKESNNSIFGDYGIEANKKLPYHPGTYYVADHLRAILDLLADGHIKYLVGMKNDFIGTDQYNQDFFDQVYLLNNNKHWQEIYRLMFREFGLEWYAYIYVKESLND
ncbi:MULTISPECIES: hypothetical protein [Aerococcus]|uniref:Uncharacterized protein n=1 Tax=Aerococcus urinae TaxID=1376 RepID=A0A0X8FFZ7_9LACT|nr:MULTISPECIES: hypothetical protein [Aerococcus]AMB95797.1 hypothetical protein AWM73_04415 [Aerococcus urinae]MCY3032374.1 hypothetical protein [Aerococcus urinae]MCY3037415.1 hypothetical protein [Aerococcus urinae]MCY3044420.1 hypothetical protein [Aerococcus urinae]MCY3046015.1 hypothetical protein [Aerococcus urinae]